MTAIYFPLKLMKEADHDWNIVGNTAVSGQTATSSVDIRSDGGGLWSAALNNIQFWDQTDTLCWRAVRQLCNGGINPIIVPRNDSTFAPFPMGNPRSYGSIPYLDTSFHSDGSGFRQSIIDVQSSGGAALRATTMTLKLNNCGPLQGGESFSIQHPTFDWRIYEIGSVVVVDSTHSIVTFNPPLREAILDGTVVEFDQPRCTMKLINAASMDLNITTWPFSVGTVKFIESKYAT
jgi:hypothetical protein